MNESQLINQGISYEFIKQIEQHAKQYDYVSDKKEFLKNVSPYEQKIILLNSHDPYEVLNYLDELDIKATRKILNELTYDEIKQILSLFSTEDKNKFYTHYSDLALVNQFIVYDKNALEHIEDLSFDRKVELIDSSNSKTVEATSKVYETLSEEQREITSDLLTQSSAVSALNVAETQLQSSVEDNNTAEKEEDNHVEQKIDEKPEKIEETKEQIEEKLDDEKQQEKEEQKLEDQPQLNKEDQQEIPKEAEIDVSEVEINDELKTIELFHQAKQQNELDFINKIKNELISKEENVINNSNQKTF